MACFLCCSSHVSALYTSANLMAFGLYFGGARGLREHITPCKIHASSWRCLKAITLILYVR